MRKVKTINFDREGKKMKDKNIKNEISKKKSNKGIFFSLVILMVTCLPLVNLAPVINMGSENVQAETLHISESASWTLNGLDICPAPNEQWYPNLISDGAGGAIITWHDFRNDITTGGDIYAQKINSAGIPQWGTNGTLICNFTGKQFNPTLASDGAGGAIITWTDERIASNQDDIYAQRISSAGDTLWDDNGTLIATGNSYRTAQQIISDGAGGAIITWYDARTFGITFFDIYAQKINSAGITQWDTNGIVICNATFQQEDPQLASDGAGGAIITWKDNRYSGTTGYDIYAQKVNSVGITQWDTNGSLICNANNNQYDPQIVSDGAGGVIITWVDAVVNDIYAQKVDSMGFLQWDDYWTLICNATGKQFNPQIISDGAGGAIITWQDERIASDQDDIYAQKKNAMGISQWDINGSLICDEANDQEYPQLTSDGAGGAIITWQDSRFGSDDIYAQKINSTGITKWDDDGNLICSAIGHQRYAQIISDGAEGAIIAWQDERVETDQDDIYAQKIADPPPNPSITINSPSNYAFFDPISGKFDVTVSGPSIQTIWYTINGGPINTIWYTMNEGSSQTFTILTTVDNTEWTTISNNTLVTVTFFVENSFGSQASSSVQVYYIKSTPGYSDPTIAINSPINATLFNSTSGIFNLTVTGTSIDTIWYTINGSLITTIWNSLDEVSIQSFMIITTLDEAILATIANNTLVNITFYVNDTSGNQVSRSVHIYITKSSTGGSGGNIPGFDLAIISILSFFTVITLIKMYEKKKRRM